MTETIIKKSERHENFRVVSVTVMAILLVILSFFILGGTRRILGLDMTAFGWMIRVFIILIAGAAVYATKRQNGMQVYTFKDNKLYVENRSVFGGSGNKQMITLNPESVSSVTLRQSNLDKQLNSGTISIVVDSRSGESTHKLANIDNPQQVLKQIENYLS